MNNLNDIGRIVNEKIEEHLKQRGVVNIIIAGKTGVGKSTLINSLFQGEIAATGQGRPVTQETRQYTKKDIPVSIYDTKGLETEKYKETLKSLETIVRLKNSEPDPKEHIHLALVCILEDSTRVEDGEIRAVDMLNSYMPVIAVITKAKSDNGFKELVWDLLPNAKNVVRVRSKAIVLEDGHILQAMGLENLIEVMMEVVPEGQLKALAAAQKVSMKKKVDQSKVVIAAAATAALATGATPIPFSDVAILAPIEIGMLAGISLCFGLRASDVLLSTLLSSITGVSLATLSGKAFVTWALKASGVGYVLGAAISGGTAATLTTTMGGIYVAVLNKLFAANNGEPPNEEDIIREFKEALKGRYKIS
jgi:predicted GTPase